jgi:hypothetical protein
MSIDEWWARLSPEVREWLIAHNGEPLSPEVAAAIERAGGTRDADAWAIAPDSSQPFELSDEVVDWIEAVANEE